MAVGQAALTPGQLVPAGTELVFELNVCDPATRGYLQRALSEGQLNLMVTTLLRASGPGATDYPMLFTRENQLAGPAQRPRLELVLNQGRRSDMNADGNLNVLDFNAFLNAFSAGSLAADMDNSCALNVLDFNAFLNAFSAGR